MNKNIILEVRRELKKQADAKTKQSFPRSFKEKIKFHGVKSALVVKTAREYFKKIKGLNKKEVFTLCEELLKSGYCEESWVAANWVYWRHKDFEPVDFNIFERWVSQYIDNWTSCDTFCNHTMGIFMEKYPEYLQKLKLWAKSKNRWVKRASAVSLIIPAKNGLFIKDVFAIADILLLDPDDLVQKGYGWLLKVAANKHLTEVFNYVVKHKKEMPRTALRYAIEKMPLHLKKEAMKKD